jgi:hypothetical protein
MCRCSSLIVVRVESSRSWETSRESKSMDALGVVCKRYTPGPSSFGTKQGAKVRIKMYFCAEPFGPAAWQGLGSVEIAQFPASYLVGMLLRPCNRVFAGQRERGAG